MGGAGPGRIRPESWKTMSGKSQKIAGKKNKPRFGLHLATFPPAILGLSLGGLGRKKRGKSTFFWYALNF